MAGDVICVIHIHICMYRSWHMTQPSNKVCVCVCMYAYVCVRACVRACVRVCDLAHDPELDEGVGHDVPPHRPVGRPVLVELPGRQEGKGGGGLSGNRRQ